MQRAIQFRRRLGASGTLLLFILFFGFFAGIKSANETRTMNRWVAHTQEVLTEAASVRLSRARMQNDLWLFRSTGSSLLRDRYNSDREQLLKSVARLKELTVDSERQQRSLEKIDALLKEQVGSLDRAFGKAESAAENKEAQDLTPAISLNDQLPILMNAFEATERQLFSDRSAKVKSSAEVTLTLLLTIGVIACGSLLAAGYYIQKEILTRAKVETGLLRARELMGAKIDRQRSELDHAMEDLHLEIRARNDAEDTMKQLNLELEARVALRTRELEESNRELEAFSYSVSHDLRAPLRHMDGFSRILEEEFATQLPEDVRRHLQQIGSRPGR